MVGNEKKISNYYNVTNGKIVKSYGKTKPEGIDTKSRINKNGDEVFEQIYDYIEGEIKKCFIESHEDFGDSIKIMISDNEKSAELSIKFDSAYGRSFLFKIPNFEYDKKIKIVPYSFINKEGKSITGLNIFQGKKIPNFYTKETPNGLPKLKKVKFNGKDQWDKTDQIEFLKEKLNDFCALFEDVEIENLNEDDPIF